MEESLALPFSISFCRCRSCQEYCRKLAREELVKEESRVLRPEVMVRGKHELGKE